MNIMRICLLLFLVGWCPRLTAAQPPVILTDARDEYPLGRFLEYLEDPTADLTIDDITSPTIARRFIPSQTVVLNFGYTRSAYWVRLRLRNLDAHATDWRLELGFANMRQIDYYRPRADSSSIARSRDVETIRTGTRYPFATRAIPYHRFVFALSLPPDAEQTIYLRFQNEASMTLPLTLWSPDAFQRHSQRTLFLSGLLYGAMLILIGYNLFLWLALREQTYGYYVGFMTCMALTQLVYEGLAGQYLWPNTPRWSEVSGLLFWAGISIAGQMFAITFLETRRRAPRGHALMFGFIVLWTLTLACIPIVSYGRLIHLTMLLRILNGIVFTGISVLIWRRGYQPARYFCLAWLSSTPLFVVFVLARLGVTPSVAITEYGYQVGVVLTGALFSFALASRIQLLRQEKDAAQRQTLLTLQDKERLIAGQNLHLEQNVRERTLALQQEIHEHQRTEAELQRAKAQTEAANQALQAENARFLGLSDATFEGILLHEQGRIIEVNRTLERLFGYSHAELLERQIHELMAPEFRAITDELMAAETERAYEFRAVRKDGATIPLEGQSRTIRYQARPIRVLALRDISWRKTLEQQTQQLESENVLLKASLSDRDHLGELIGRSPAMQKVYERLLKAAASDAPVMIYGETGAGKELVARTIWQLSDQYIRIFIPVNCAAVQEPLFESQFFGYRKGAFTGATRNEPGYFEQAQGGILFLDEISELLPVMQAKLLRVLNDGEYTPVGATQPRRADVRIMAASNQSLREMVSDGRFRADLFHRLHVLALEVPPLRQRKEDLPLLIAHFLRATAPDSEPPQTLPSEILARFQEYDWPGNVRELANEVRRYVTLDEVELHSPYTARTPRRAMPGQPFNAQVAAFESQIIADALAKTQGHRAKAAELLHIPTATLYRKIEKYKL